MPEILGNRYEGQENRNSESISVFDGQKYESELQGFYKNNINNPDSIQTLKDFIDKQEQDKTKLKENLEKSILNETREQLDKQAMINEAKIMLYEKTGIDNNLENNSSFENFIKGVIDGGILDNYDLALQVYETNGKIILDGLKELASWEGLKNLASAIGEDIGTLFTGNAYERGKVSAEVVLALLTAGAGLTINVTKKGVKLGIKELSKLRVNKERLVESPEVKNVINETNIKLDEIVPKHEVDLRKQTLDSLPENVRNLDLELDNYSPQQLEGIKIRLGLDKKATIEDIDLAYRIKLQGVLERYRELSDVNLKRFESEILANLEKAGDVNPIKALEDEIIKLELMKDRGELLVVSAISGDVYKSGIQFTKFSYLDSLEPDIKEELIRKSKKYMQLRENTEIGIGNHGLESKYSSFLINKKELDNISDYGDDNIRFIGYNIDELEGRAGVTLYDSMLSGKLDGPGKTNQMLEFTKESLIKTKAIYNIDERLGYSIHERLKKEAINGNNGEMRRFFEGIKPYVEVHIYGGNSSNVKGALNKEDFINKYFNK